MIRLSLVVALFASSAVAAWPPVAVTDPPPASAGITHCVLIVDGVRGADVPLQLDGSCRIDVSKIAAGPRRIQVAWVRYAGGVREEGTPTAYGESCALVQRPSNEFRIGWSNLLTCTKASGCITHCP